MVSFSFLLISCQSTDTRTSRFKTAEATLQQWRKGDKQADTSAHQWNEIEKQFVEIYRENSLDEIAFQSIRHIFFATRDPALKKEQLRLLTNYHTANPEAATLLTGPIGPTVLTPEYIHFFETFISKESPPESRISAMIALAQSYDAVLNARASFMRSQKTAEQYLLEQSQIPPTDSALKTFQHWMTSDTHLLSKQIRTLANRVLQENPKLELQYYSPSKGLRYIAQAGQIAEGLLNGLALTPGSPAPDTVLTTLDGQVIKVSDYSGSVVMLDFWATWCIPCVQSIPHHRQLVEELSGQPFLLITISVDTELQDVSEFLADHDMPFINTYIGPDSDLLSTWNVSSYPTVFLIDQSGKIVMRHQGNTEELKREINQLLISDE
ncbi:TlpA disulfide reductase family protein [Porticoccaceae bacterium LTM1]|nr:TlpA disulfide reductase family protein [Porticoccaceae bacterium LTM1]